MTHRCINEGREIAESEGIDSDSDGILDECWTPPRIGGDRVTP
jgi:hypothetical protein